MVDLDASFFHHLLELAVADRVRHIPAYTPKDDLPLKMTAFEIDHYAALHCQTTIIARQEWGHSFATEPEMATGLGTALREAGMTYPVYFAASVLWRYLATIITSVDAPHDDWEKVVTTVSEIIGVRLGAGGLRSRDLPCAAVNLTVSGADVITD